MLLGVPKIIPPELLKILMEMGHGDEIIGGVGAPARLVDFELPSDVDHNESQADVEQGVGSRLETRIGRAECAGKQLRGDEAQHQKERERKNFSH